MTLAISSCLRAHLTLSHAFINAGADSPNGLSTSTRSSNDVTSSDTVTAASWTVTRARASLGIESMCSNKPCNLAIAKCTSLTSARAQATVLGASWMVVLTASRNLITVAAVERRPRTPVAMLNGSMIRQYTSCREDFEELFEIEHDLWREESPHKKRGPWKSRRRASTLLTPPTPRSPPDQVEPTIADIWCNTRLAN